LPIGRASVHSVAGCVYHRHREFGESPSMAA